MAKYIRGGLQLIQALKNRHKQHHKRAMRGLERAAKLIKKRSDHIVPIEFGDLTFSSFIEKEPNGYVIGYSDPKAIWVHEDLNKAHGEVYNKKYADDIRRGVKFKRRPQEQAKFLEQPFRETQKETIEFVKEEIRRNRKGS